MNILISSNKYEYLCRIKDGRERKPISLSLYIYKDKDKDIYKYKDKDIYKHKDKDIYKHKDPAGIVGFEDCLITAFKNDTL